MTNPDGVLDPDDGKLVAAALRGDDRALETLRGQHYSRLIGILVQRGALPAEAEEIVADIWSELVSPHEGKQPLLEKYQSRSPLGAWLLTVATHRLIDRKRRGKLFAASTDEYGMDSRPPEPASPVATNERDLLGILRRAVADAFASCPAETLVMLKLVYLHGVTRREIGRVWRWHESKVSRHLDLCRCTPDLFALRA